MMSGDEWNNFCYYRDTRWAVVNAVGCCERGNESSGYKTREIC